MFDKLGASSLLHICKHPCKLQAEEFWPEDDEQEEERGMIELVLGPVNQGSPNVISCACFLRKLQADEFWPEDDEQEEEMGISQI